MVVGRVIERYKILIEVVLVVVVLFALFVLFRGLVREKMEILEKYEEVQRYMFYSEYYTKAAQVMWGDNSYRCDIGLIRKIETVIKELRDSLVTVDLVLAVMAVESGFNRKAKSHAGAIGLMQIMPSTARMHDKTIREQDLYDEYINIKIGVMELSRLLKVFGGNVELALLAYNRGQGRVMQLMNTTELRNAYPAKVLKYKLYN